jgi:hypothetical protein
MVSSTTVSIILLIVLIAPTIGFYIGSVAINIQKYTEGHCEFPEGVCKFGAAIGFPEGWMAPGTFIWYGIIPIMGVWLTIYGFMDKIKIFNGAITAGLSFLMAFSTIPLGLFVVMVVALYQLMGIYATVGLAILFFVGIFFDLRNTIGGMSSEFKAYDTKIKQLEQQKSFLEEDAKGADKRMREIEKRFRQGNLSAQVIDELRNEFAALANRRRVNKDSVGAIKEEVKNFKAENEALKKRVKKK